MASWEVLSKALSTSMKAHAAITLSSLDFWMRSVGLCFSARSLCMLTGMQRHSLQNFCSNVFASGVSRSGLKELQPTPKLKKNALENFIYFIFYIVQYIWFTDHKKQSQTGRQSNKQLKILFSIHENSYYKNTSWKWFSQLFIRKLNHLYVIRKFLNSTKQYLILNIQYMNNYNSKVSLKNLSTDFFTQSSSVGIIRIGRKSSRFCPNESPGKEEISATSQCSLLLPSEQCLAQCLWPWYSQDAAGMIFMVSQNSLKTLLLAFLISGSVCSGVLCQFGWLSLALMKSL